MARRMRRVGRARRWAAPACGRTDANRHRRRSCGTACQTRQAPGIPCATNRACGSGKNAVNKPARRWIAGQSGAKQPETAAGLVLDAVIVANGVGDAVTAGQPPLGTPPFLGDALGPVDLGDAMRPATPGKAR